MGCLEFVLLMGQQILKATTQKRQPLLTTYWLKQSRNTEVQSSLSSQSPGLHFIYTMASYLYLTYTYLPEYFKSSPDSQYYLLQHKCYGNSLGHSANSSFCPWELSGVFPKKYFDSAFDWICRHVTNRYRGADCRSILHEVGDNRVCVEQWPNQPQVICIKPLLRCCLIVQQAWHRGMSNEAGGIGWDLQPILIIMIVIMMVTADCLGSHRSWWRCLLTFPSWKLLHLLQCLNYMSLNLILFLLSFSCNLMLSIFAWVLKN